MLNKKDDNDWVKRCITWEVEGIRQRGRLKKTWWDCVRMCSPRISGGELTGNQLTQVHLEQWSLKWHVSVLLITTKDKVQRRSV